MIKVIDDERFSTRDPDWLSLHPSSLPLSSLLLFCHRDTFIMDTWKLVIPNSLKARLGNGICVIILMPKGHIHNGHVKIGHTENDSSNLTVRQWILCYFYD